MAQRYRGGNSQSGSNAKYKPIISGGIIIGIVVLVIAIGPTAGWWGATADVPVETPATEEALPTIYEFEFIDILSLEEVTDVNISIYELDVSEMTDDEILDADLADFTLDKTIDEDKSYTPTTDCIYIALVDSDVHGSKYFIPSLGLNTITMYNQTSIDFNIIGMEHDGASTTFNQTTEDEWILSVIATQANVDFDYGLESSEDMSNEVYDRCYWKITCNTTAEYSFMELEGAYDEIISGNDVYYVLSEAITSEAFQSFVLDMNEDKLNTDFEVTTISFGYGNIETTTTDYDTQN